MQASDMIVSYLKPCPVCGQDESVQFQGHRVRKLSAMGFYGVMVCRGCGHQAPPTTWHVEYDQAKVVGEAVALWNSHENAKPREFRVLSPEQVESAAKAYYRQKMEEARRSTKRYPPPPKPTPWWRKIIKRMMS